MGLTLFQGMILFKFLVYYAIPLLFISFFYIVMAQHLHKSTRNIPGESQGQSKQIQSRKKVFIAKFCSKDCYSGNERNKKEI